MRFSFYRPRDIIAYLSILGHYSKDGQECFSVVDFKDSQVQRDYSNYLLGEIKDNLSFYHGSNDFDMFRNFFMFIKKSVNERDRTFGYSDYIAAFDDFVQHNQNQATEISQIFKTADHFLQMLFELTMLGGSETETFAFFGKASDLAGTDTLVDSALQAEVEIWRYNPTLLSKHPGVVDTLSLAASLSADDDARVEQAIDGLLSSLWG